MIKICNYPLEYFIYIIIFILVLTIIISLFRTNTTTTITTDTFDKKVIEKFEDDPMNNGLNNNGINNNGLITNELDKYKRKLELSKIKEDRLKTEIELIKNYTKINDNNFNNIHTHASKIFFGNGFMIFPALKDNAKIVDSNNNLNFLISKTSNLKNIYKVGEKVLNDSTFYITNNDICYSNIPSSETGLYNGCIACSINPSNNFISSKNKTNIESVCLYNDSENKIDSTIPTSSLCENICIGRG